MSKLLISNIKIDLEDSESIAISRAKKILKKENLNINNFEFSVFKRSIDARDKNHILLVYTILATSLSDINFSSNNANVR